ncbi:hypothetical protein PAXRUDRAFT_28398 [Paxillus rubicundulus Ve08.2h10]|uniref:Uncharacterized protein n=1 Tax=Paxillus rubicundulus Ve08.2h10 TaxID=930991 RepID=A0A0D0DEX1_9AGAM|nr:hypothetical protein PAXRUDRAFT_28398 [Paxillus rubicundulus Ve08.2h10]
MPIALLLPPLPIVPLNPDILSIDVIFHPCIVAQCMSNDLVIYMCDLGQIITITYPLGPNGVRIVPGGIFKWMERHGLVLECFCALMSGQPTPACFVNEYLSRHTIVHCHHIDNQCGFYLNVTNIHVMTLLESAYWHIPTTSYTSEFISQFIRTSANFIAASNSRLHCQSQHAMPHTTHITVIA